MTEDKILFVQTAMKERDLERLKEKTGQRQTKEALYAAVKKYLEE